jgi:hypothetical protein
VTAAVPTTINSAHNIRMPIARIMRPHALVVRPDDATQIIAAAAESIKTRRCADSVNYNKDGDGAACVQRKSRRRLSGLT